MSRVLITGTFDIIHPGHLNLIKQARALGDFLIAVIARDKNVLKIKGQLPHFGENQRWHNLLNTGLVGKVVLGDLHDPYKIISVARPDIVALGYDQQAFVNGLIDFKAKSRASFSINRLEPFKEDFCKSKNIRKAIEDKQAGFLLIDKVAGWTSHDVVAKLRSAVKIKQIGHAGTLDPFATGLLICAVSSAAKMVGLFDLLPKTYEAEIKFGVVSDTYDRTGKLEEAKKLPANKFNKKEIEKVLAGFVGKQKQIPPMYSAKKVQGKKLYELARQGKTIERKPGNIEIHVIKLLDFKADVLRLRVSCSAGTYIRSLAHDLGIKLGTGAVLWELKRLSIGDFFCEQADNIGQINQANWQDYLIRPDIALAKINRTYQKNLGL